MCSFGCCIPLHGCDYISTKLPGFSHKTSHFLPLCVVKYVGTYSEVASHEILGGFVEKYGFACGNTILFRSFLQLKLVLILDHRRIF